MDQVRSVLMAILEVDTLTAEAEVLPVTSGEEDSTPFLASVNDNSSTVPLTSRLTCAENVLALFFAHVAYKNSYYY